MAGHKKDDKHPKKNENSSDNKVPTLEPDSEGSVAPSRGIALAAKDSEWIGMRTDFASNDCTDCTFPLFPGINFSDSTESTTVITKLLVGKTADFSRLPKPQRVFITKHLSTVKEQSKEDFNPSDSDVSSILRTAEPNGSATDVEVYDDDDDEPKRATHTKRRKKKSDLKDLPGETSSVSLIPTVRRKSGSKMRQADNKAQSVPYVPVFERASWAMSNDADDEYQTQSDETIANNNVKKD